MSNLYEIYNRLVDKVAVRPFSETVHLVDLACMNEFERDIVIAMLAMKYSRKKSVAFENIQNNTDLNKSDISRVVVIGRDIGKLDEQSFNTLVDIICHKLGSGYTWTTVSRSIKIIASGNVEVINQEVIDGIDYTKPLLLEISRLRPDFKAVCDTCGRELGAEEFKKSYSSCLSCRKKAKGVKCREIRSVGIKKAVMVSVSSINDRVKEY